MAKEVELAAPPSLLSSNLISHGGRYLTYASRSDLITVNASNFATQFKCRLSGGDIHHAAGVEDPGTNHIIVIACTANAGATLVINGSETISVGPTTSGETAACAAVQYDSSSGALWAVVGCSGGSVLLQGAAFKDGSVALSGQPIAVQAHEGCFVAAVDAHRTGVQLQEVKLVSGDSRGKVILWTGSQPTRVIPAVDPTDAIAAVRFVRNGAYVAVAYGCGALHLIDAASGAPHLRVRAHSRWIHAMAYCPLRDYLCTASEDSQLYVWNMAAAEAAEVYIARAAVPNEIPTGVAFNGQGTEVILLTYDTPKVRVYACA